MKQVKQFSGRPSYKVGMKKSFSISCRVPYLPSDPQRQTGTFALAEPGIVCYTAVFSFVQPRPQGFSEGKALGRRLSFVTQLVGRIVA